MANTCSNPECGKTYNITDKDADHDFCCFECWETQNCAAPKKAEPEEILLD